MKKVNKLTLEDLRYKLEMDMAMKCYKAEEKALKEGREFKCTCKDPWKMSRKEILEYYKEKE